MSVIKARIYYDIETGGTLPSSGRIEDEKGWGYGFDFESDENGISVFEPDSPDYGMYGAPCSSNISVPSRINGVPVVTVKGHVRPKEFPFYMHPVLLEGLELKKADITIVDDVSKPKRRSSLDYDFSDFDFPEQHESEAGTVFNLDMVCPLLEELILRSDKPIVLSGKLKARTVRISAPKVFLNNVKFSEEITEFQAFCPISLYEKEEPREGYKYADNNVFSGLKKLRIIDGALHGKQPYHFQECRSLKEIHFSNDSASVVDDEAFLNCESIEDIYLPDCVSSIGCSAFSGCTSLKSIHLPKTISVFPKFAFFGDASLEKVFFPDALTAIEESAFEGCENLAEPFLPMGLTKIGARAFKNCKRFRVIFIPDSVTEFGEAVFEGCEGLTLRVHKNSRAEQYCIENALNYQLV